MTGWVDVFSDVLLTARLTATHRAHACPGAYDPQPDLRLLIRGSEDRRAARSAASCAWCSHGCQPAGLLTVPPVRAATGLHVLPRATNCHCGPAITVQTMTSCFHLVCRCVQTLRPASSWRQSSSWSSAADAASPGHVRRVQASRASCLADVAARQVVQLFYAGSRRQPMPTDIDLSTPHVVPQLIPHMLPTCLLAERVGL